MEVIIKKEVMQVLDKWEIQYRAINQVIAICGTVQRLSNSLKLGKKGRERISKWRNERIKIPLQYAIEMEELTGISGERLSPFTERANKIIHKSPISTKMLPIAVLCKEITIPKNLLLAHPAERPIIISADLVLISGLEQLAAARAMGKTEIFAIILDLEAWLAKIKIPNPTDFLTSELIAMSVALKPLMGNRQGQRNDLLELKKELKNDQKVASLHRKCDEVNLRTNQQMAEMLGFKNKDAFHRALQACEKGIPALVDALNYKKIAFANAAKISKLSANEQLKSIATHLAKKRRCT